VVVQHIADDRVKLLEYENVESDMKTRVEVARVLRVDESIQLSTKKVTAEEIISCVDRWNKARWVHNLMSRVAVLCSQQPDLEEWDLLRLSQRISWLPGAYERLQNEDIDADLGDRLVQLLVKNIREQRDRTQQARVDVICYRYGTKSLVKALLSILTEMSAYVTLDKSASYTVATTDREVLHKVCAAIARRVRDVVVTEVKVNLVS
jgi:translation initiation factor 2 alpha subunit (eIF-2alpha)